MCTSRLHVRCKLLSTPILLPLIPPFTPLYHCCGPPLSHRIIPIIRSESGGSEWETQSEETDDGTATEDGSEAGSTTASRSATPSGTAPPSRSATPSRPSHKPPPSLSESAALSSMAPKPMLTSEPAGVATAAAAQKSAPPSKPVAAPTPTMETDEPIPRRSPRKKQSAFTALNVGASAAFTLHAPAGPAVMSPVEPPGAEGTVLAEPLLPLMSSPAMASGTMASSQSLSGGETQDAAGLLVSKATSQLDPLPLPSLSPVPERRSSPRKRGPSPVDDGPCKGFTSAPLFASPRVLDKAYGDDEFRRPGAPASANLQPHKKVRMWCVWRRRAIPPNAHTTTCTPMMIHAAPPSPPTPSLPPFISLIPSLVALSASYVYARPRLQLDRPFPHNHPYHPAPARYAMASLLAHMACDRCIRQNKSCPPVLVLPSGPDRRRR